MVRRTTAPTAVLGCACASASSSVASVLPLKHPDLPDKCAYPSGWCLPSSDRQLGFPRLSSLAQPRDLRSCPSDSILLSCPIQTAAPTAADCVQESGGPVAGCAQCRALCSGPVLREFTGQQGHSGQPPFQSSHRPPNPLPRPRDQLIPQLILLHTCCSQHLDMCPAAKLTQTPFLLPPAPHQQLFWGGDATAPCLSKVSASWAHTSPGQGLLCPGELRGEPR